MERQTDERREVGLELHHAETAIHLGRKAINDLLAEEPVDYDAIANLRADLHEARLARNALRTRLASVKRAARPFPRHRW